MHLLGFRREEVVGRSFGSFMTREGGDLFRQYWGEMMKSGTLKKEYVLVSMTPCQENVKVR